MLVAISSEIKDINSPLSPHFGKSKYFFLFDTIEQKYSLVENNALNTNEGKGIEVVNTLLKSNIKIIFSGHFGSSVIDYCNKNNIQLVMPNKSETIQTIINKLK